MPIKQLFRAQEKIKGNGPQARDASAQSNSPTPQPSQLPDQEFAEEQMPATFYERDNRATRIMRVSQADDFWRQHQECCLKEPFLRYVFDSEAAAVDALQSLGCIHRAGDTGNLLCTEPIVMGCYRTMENCYEVFLAGKELNYATWSEAGRKFSEYGGRHRGQLKPETDDRYRERSDIQQVVFEKEYYQMGPGGTCFYQVFKAPSVTAARSFLLQHENMINVPDQAIIVETPEGTLCSNRAGIQERS